MPDDKQRLLFGPARYARFQRFNTGTRCQLLPLRENPALAECFSYDLCAFDCPGIRACCYAAEYDIAGCKKLRNTENFSAALTGKRPGFVTMDRGCTFLRPAMSQNIYIHVDEKEAKGQKGSCP